MENTPVPLSWSPVEGAQGYRLMLYDRTVAEIFFDETVPGPRHSVVVPPPRRSHDLDMRVRPFFDDSSAGEWTEFRPLPLELVLGERREPLPPLATADRAGLLLMLTVDTECSTLRQPRPDPDRVVDELIFGEFGQGGRPGGIGLHMDLLEHFGFRGCFFLDVLMEYQHGRAALERTVEAIAARGHEIELHVHADHLEWSGDPHLERLSGALGGPDPDVFRRALELSVQLFERRVGRPPIAYRAGGYRIADMHFPLLEEFGIRIDSSVQPYYNSRVSDWMRTRTQPFWVGGVLEAPPTLLFLNEVPDAWEARGLLPNPQLGDPISTMPAPAGAPPLVATYVSHSFQLLRGNRSTDPDEVEEFSQQLRSALPAAVAERLIRRSPREVRTYGEEVDDRLVAALAGILRRVADRPDARCATYADLDRVARGLWQPGSHASVDPVPLLDRRRGTTGTTATRVLGRDFLAHLSGGRAVTPPSRVGAATGPGSEGLEARSPRELLDALAGLGELGPEATVPVRLRTLGIAPPGARGSLPPLAELLFPLAAVRAVAAEVGAEPPAALAWDVPTWLAWLAASGLEPVRSRRLPRAAADLAAVEGFEQKLRWLDPRELRTEVLLVELRRASPGGRPVPLDPERLPATAAELYGSLRPGEAMWLPIGGDSGPESRTATLLAMTRAGLEVLDGTVSGYRLLRPLELADVRRFAGLG
jgi:hypothetical protein